MLYKFINKKTLEKEPKGVTIDSTCYSRAPMAWLEANGYKPLVDEIGEMDAEKVYDDYYVELSKKIAHRVKEAKDSRTQAEKRECAYRVRACIDYNGEKLTVDEARDLLMKYMAEDAEDVVSLLKTAIKNAKAEIRADYPEEV